ncbi:Protein F10D11.6 a, partial [Aphelenchoides avenae]
LNGCIYVYNLYVSRYRCAQRIVAYPSPPNQIVISVQNLDIGVTGNLGGRVNLLLPLGLTGIIQLNAHQVSLTAALTISRGANGAPSIGIASCNVQIGYVDVYIENGGLIGDLANSQFRGRLSSTIKKLLPGQLCSRLPSIVNEQLNGRLGAIPQSIALTQILQIAGGALGLSRIANRQQQ